MASKSNRIQQALQTALTHHQAGRFGEAGTIYQQVLSREPENADANHLLGLLAHQAGRNETALQLITKALQISPNHLPFINSLGSVYMVQGKLDEAERTFKRALRLQPNLSEAHINLGNILRAQGKMTDAEKCYRQASRIKPDYFAAHYNLGTVLLHQGKLDDAAVSYNRALGLKPDSAEAYNNLGIVLEKQGNLTESAEAIKKALGINPNYAEAHNNLGITLQSLGKLAASEEAYKSALSIKPDFSTALKNLGYIFEVQDKFMEAQRCYRKALEVRPDFAQVYLQLALLYNQKLNIPHYSAQHEDINKIKTLLNFQNMSSTDAMELHFALGEIYDNCDMPDEAFKHFQQANMIGYGNTNFSMQKSMDFTAQVTHTFNRNFLNKLRLRGSSSSKPVFIVGLPRAGKTLVEKLLSVHDTIYAGGELLEINRLILRELPVILQTNASFPSFVEEIDNRSASEIANKYINYLVELTGTSFTRISNTLTSNAKLLGILSMLFPNCKIIYCRRNKLDNCLAMYFKSFKPGYDYSCDLHDLGFFYRQYEKLMRHWQRVLPIPILEINYEELVQAPAVIAPELIDHLELEWDAECASKLNKLIHPGNFEKTGYRLTAGHSRGIGWSAKYSKFLTPLEESLEQFKFEK